MIKTSHNFQQVVKYVVFVIFLLLFFVLLKPFFTAIVFAGVFAAVFYPLYEKLAKKISTSSAAFVTVIATILIIMTPLFFSAGLIAQEALELSRNFDSEKILQIVSQYENTTIFGYKIHFTEIQTHLQQWATSAGNQVYTIAQDIGKSLANFSFHFFIFLFLYFQFLKDGPSMLKKAENILPFEKKQNTILLQQSHLVAKTVFMGNAIAALLAGVIAYIGFLIFQIPGALIWGILAGLLSLIPNIGTFFIYIIGALTALYLNGYMGLTGVLIYYIIVDVICRENIIKPKILDEKFSIHPLLIFFGLVGGVQAFGSAGLLYGPLIVVLFLSMYEFITITEKNG